VTERRHVPWLGRAAFALAAAGLAFAAGRSGWVLSRPGPPTPLAAVAGDVAGATATAADLPPVAAAATSPVDERCDAATATLFGTCRDGDGRPLVGHRITVQREGHVAPSSARLQDLDPRANRRVRSHPGRSVVTDAAGDYRFEDLDAAVHLVDLAPMPDAERQRVELAPGRTTRLDYTAPHPIVALRGRVLRRGLPVPHWQVLVAARDFGQRDRSLQTDAAGTFLAHLAPGRWQLRVGCGVELIRSVRMGAIPNAHERDLVLLPGMHEHAVDLVLPGTRLVAIVDAGGRAPIADLVVRFTRVDTDGASLAEFELPATDGRTAVLDDPPFGRWRLVARSPRLLARGGADVEISPARPEAEAVLSASEAALVQLHLRRADGREYEPPIEALPRLHTAVGPLPAGDLGPLFGQARRRVPGWTSVPPGPAEVAFADEVGPGTVRFLPFDPPPAQSLRVVPGDHNRLEYTVVPRAHGNLIAAERFGREAIDGHVRVFAGATEVVPSAQPRPSRWAGHLPPGSYRAEVAFGGVATDHELVVQRADFTLRLRRP
jgi:hypothetical protein